jgi:heat shock protein HslJ
MTIQFTKTNLWKGLVAMAVATFVVLAISWASSLSVAAGSIIDLDGTNWTLLSINSEAALPGSLITADFAEGKIAGSAGVNNYFASYEVEGDVLTVGPAGSTMMMGPENLMEQEWAFLSALQTAESFQVDGDTLEIVYEGGALQFAAGK